MRRPFGVPSIDAQNVTSRAMRTHSITIVASGLDHEADDFEDRLFEAGCDDATISVQKGLIILEFAREARTFAAALISAMRDVRRAGATIERVEPDHLVSASDIASRSGIGRAAVSLYASGKRGEGFPHPVARVTSDSPLWDWFEVASWMHHRKQLDLSVVLRAKMVREANTYFRQSECGTSRLARHLKRTEGRELHAA